MSANTLSALVAAMIDYLQSVGLSRRELASYAQLSPDQLEMCETRLSATQLQRLWQLIQSRLLPSLSFSQRVRPLIVGQLHRGPVNVEIIAAELHMSRHTLYKKLKAENLTFAMLLEDVRRERALMYLRERERSLAEVAELLGFSEPSAFSRAFKRWMGKSPGEYRYATL